MRLTVDRDRCISSGQCVLAAPGVFDQDDDGVVSLKTAAPPPEAAQDVSRAAALCPAMAITTEG